MAEKWERTYNEIAADAGELRPRDDWPWARLFKILRSKFEPIVDLNDADLERYRLRVASRMDQKKTLYLFDTAICSFCRRAEHETRSITHHRRSRACLACILRGKCFDHAWVVRPIYHALEEGNFSRFRVLVRQGLSDIAQILKDNDDDGPTPT